LERVASHDHVVQVYETLFVSEASSNPRGFSNPDITTPSHCASITLSLATNRLEDRGSILIPLPLRDAAFGALVHRYIVGALDVQPQDELVCDAGEENQYF
jgi:hypothetical protein